MGYYDDHSNGRYREKRGRGGFFFSSLVGAVIGAVLVVMFIPNLANSGVLPYDIQPKNQVSTETGTNNQQGFVQQNVSYNVTTNTTKAVDQAGPAVVGITNIQSTQFWSDNGKKSEEAAGTGSGVIYKKAGNKAFIVTNHHVVEGATKLEVSLTDGTKIPADLLGSDIWTDLAVLEIDASHVKKIAQFGNSDELKMGEPVIAIGNPLGPTFSGSVTQGIVSGLKRTIPVDINQDGIIDWQAEVLQTDAAINPGNSGGALVNIAGQVVGINSMKISQEAVEGIGLSIPINSAKPIINDLEQYGNVKRPYMGVDLKSVSEIPAYYQEEALKLPRDVNYGVALREVVPNSPADQAGLKELDVIVEMDGKKINDVLDLRKHLYQSKKIGEQMKIKFYRGGKLNETTLKLISDKTQ
ncbi:trypsin-like peptidase domain-containing protein [Neobacillus cucumis]|uniref:S1C family serine protease n=1 Tax=Neobacillus cucumis TaxID=1740721 RepID=UPI0018E059F6|nr:trypsin-like peptidase domain-containing protein [Neobacillus cucumis]MBI0578253.1 trypsin-like peptidase domain-containing protein [Neobacillus cucumis]WHY91968.1 trypsin-like peptidase domain-containing protein [Neobacillus cucumis]